MHEGFAAAAEVRIVAALRAAGDPEDAAHMAAYMRDRFPFLGVRAAARRVVWRAVRAAVVAEHGEPDVDELLELAERLWERPERELQYVAADALVQRQRLLDAGHLPRLRALLTTTSWWDTVDVLAPKVVGPLARRDPTVVRVLDAWVVDPDQWLVRSALLHQLHARTDTNADRLARYCRTAAARPELFVRKAIGWSLRQYSYVDGAWVEALVADSDLAPLSAREALRAIRRDRARS